MKIAFLGLKGIPGQHGVEVVVDSIVPHLIKMGHEITVYGYDSYAKDLDDYKKVKIKTVKGFQKKNLEMISHMFKASMAERREEFDIVHIHSTDPCLLAWLPKARYGIIATSHGQAYLRAKWGRIAKMMSKIAERCFIHLPDLVTSVSKPLANYYKNKYGKEVFYIPNGITFRRAPDYSYLNKWKLKPKKYLFCSAGRIERTKGIHTLLEAYSLLNTSLPLVIAGGGRGSDFDYLKKLKLNIKAGVKFVGFLTGEELFSLYAHAGVFIFPSEVEAMSMALLEGISFGVPCVYSNVPENEAVV